MTDEFPRPSLKLPKTPAEAMTKYFLTARLLERTTAGTPEEFYGFTADDVLTLHFEQLGGPGGIFFRLKDGRVFTWDAQLTDPDPLLYDAETH
jgi:hypothetical protein